MHSADPTPRVEDARASKGALLGGAAAMLLALLAYLNALPNPFVYDDYHTVVANPSLRSGNPLAVILYDITRPIVNLTYAWDHLLWQERAWGYRLTNVLIHVVNVGLLARLAWRLADDRRATAPPGTEPATSPATFAFVVASLFAVHPLLSQAVGYVSARHELLCATFFVLALLAGRAWMRGQGTAWGAAMVIAWLAALTTKEVGAVFPFVLLISDVLWGPAERRRQRLLRMHLPLIGVTILLGIARLLFLALVEYPGQVRLHPEFTWLVLDVLRRYTSLLLMPLGQTAFHAVASVESALDPRAMGGVALLALVGVLAVWLKRAHGIATFGLAWFVLALMPGFVLTLFDRGEPMSEHRVYVASIGFLLAIAVGFAQLDRAWRRWPRVYVLGRIGFAVVLLALVALTTARNRIWSQPVALWGEAVDKAPTHPRPRLLLGEALEDLGRLDAALSEYQTALTLQPANVDAHLKLGQLFARTRRFADAREHFSQALQIDPGNPFARQSMTRLDDRDLANERAR